MTRVFKIQRLVHLLRLRGKKVSADKRIDDLSKDVNKKFGTLYKMWETFMSKSNNVPQPQDTGGILARQIPVLQDDDPSGMRGPVSEADDPSGCAGLLFHWTMSWTRSLKNSGNRQVFGRCTMTTSCLSLQDRKKKILLAYCQMTRTIKRLVIVQNQLL